MTGKGDRATPASRTKKPHPLLSPPFLVTVGLVFVLFEVVLWAAVGLLWWAAVNVVLVLVLLGSLRWALAWWRRQLAPTSGGKPATGRAAAAPVGTGGRSPLGRLLGRGRSGTGRSGGPGGARSGGAGGSGSGRKGGLGRLLSGGRRTGSGPAGRTGSGRSGSGLRGLLGARRSGGSGGRSAGSGTGGRTGSTRRGGLAGALGRMRSGGRGLLGRSRSGGSTGRGASGRSGSGGTSSRRSGAGPAVRGLFGGRPRSTGRTGSGSRPRTASLAGFFKGVRQGAEATKRKPSPGPTTARKTEPAKPEPKPAEKTAPRQQAGRKPDPQPRVEAPKEPTMVQHQDDASLQKWGRNLSSVSPAIEELAKSADSQGQLAGAVSVAVSKLANQGDDELPAAKTVVAETAAIAAELKQIEAEQAAAAGRLRSLMGRADALGASYRRNHEVDEARLAGERGGRHRERRADVTAAEQDT